MRADICDPSDAKKVERFRAVLSEIGAIKKDEAWAIGVDMWTVAVQKEELCIFQDSWSLDVEGPDDVVSDILRRMKE